MGRFCSPIVTEPRPAQPGDYEMRACGRCGREHLLPNDDIEAVCFACWRADHPFEGVPGLRIDAAGDDATSAARVDDRTARFNVGLPGVETVVGTRRSYDPNLDGKPMTHYRPITNAEVGSNRKRKELAKRAGLVPLVDGIYRSPR